MCPPWRRLVLVSAAVGVFTSCGGSRFVSVTGPAIALTHVHLIDGTGRPGADDQAVVIQDGRIAGVDAVSRIAIPPAARVLDLQGRTVLPGLVGMHDHLFYQYELEDGQGAVARAAEAFAKLYLATGVTAIRTAGTLDLPGDLRLKRAIDDGRAPGPHIHVTGRYLYAQSESGDPDAIAAAVSADADAGATSFKAYTSLHVSELRAAIRAAHDRGLKITGHLCTVGFREAAAMGIDNVEHGVPFDTEFYSGKRPDGCPNQYAVFDELSRMDITDVEIQRTIRELVRHGVAVTSTLAVLEMYAGREDVLDPRTLGVLTAGLRDRYTATREKWRGVNNRTTWLWSAMLRKEMAFERAFVSAGGRLMAGVDPTGWGGIVAGFGDQRELELLVEAGFSPEHAIKIASANGAAFLDDAAHTGTLAVGKDADLVVVRGNPSVRISDIRNVELVFKDGIGYDPAALVASAQGGVGRFDVWHMFYSPVDVSLMCLVGVLFACVVWKRTRRIPAAGAVVRRQESVS